MDLDERRFSVLAEIEVKRCRPGDWEHAKRVVRWVKEIGSENKHLQLLIATAYIHDIGWRDVLPNKNQLLSKKDLLQYEPVANSNSEPYVSEFLTRFGFSKSEIALSLRLVKAADKHASSDVLDAIIVDADNLSKTDLNHFKEKYQKESWLEIYKFLEEEFPTSIKTPKGKRLAPRLLKSLYSEIQRELGL